MIGFRRPQSRGDFDPAAGNGDVAKVFFDTFSKRVGGVEEDLRRLSSEFEKLKLAGERSQISDLVLLDRIQKAERLIRESLESLKTAVEKAIESDVQEPRVRMGHSETLDTRGVEPASRDGSLIPSHVLSPTGELGSLPSITTPTELQVLTLLAREGPKSAPEIGRVVGRSREHTARLMKRLFEEGYIRRDQTRIPFRYSVVDRLKQTVRKSESKDEEKEQISVPQT